MPDTRAYPEPIVIAGLLGLLSQGTAEAARQLLETQFPGQRIPSAATLNIWRHTKAERLAELHKAHGAELEQEQIRMHQQVANAANEAALLAVQLAKQQILAGEIKDAAGAARNLMVTSGTSTDKGLLLDGRPTKITEHRDPEAILASLKRLGVIDATIEPTAELEEHND